MLVIVVPILAPIIMGIALSSVTDPDATSATTRAVVVELLCNIAVMSNPMNRPVNGLDVATRIVSAAFFPKCCSDEVIKSSAKRKSRKAPRIETTTRILFQTFLFGSIGGVAGSKLRFANTLS